MITSAFIQLGSGIISMIGSIFPASEGIPQGFSDSVNTFAGYTSIFSPIFDFGTMSTLVSLLIAFELIVFGFKTFKWLFSHVPAIGGRG